MLLPRAWVRSSVFPFHEILRGRPTVSILERLREHDKLPPVALDSLHAERLGEHLKRVARVVPFYARTLAGTTIRSAADLAAFPIIDKRTIREHFAEFRASDWRGRVLTLETGGSSGEPLRFETDPVREASQLACKWRARSWFGLHVGHRELDLWGSPIETGKLSWQRRLSGDLLGNRLLSAFAMSEEKFAVWRDEIDRHGSDFLYGYSSVLARFARYLIAERRSVPTGRLRVAIGTAEMLPPADRAVMVEAFGCPVAAEYGCRDGGLIAHECPSGGLHLMHDAIHVELLDAAGQPVKTGEEGEVCLTNLYSQAFPLIRYRLGDLAVRSPTACPCGLPHPTLARLTGRSTDTLFRDDGARVHGLALIYVLRELPGVDRFRIHQKQLGRVEVSVVPGAAWSEERVGPDLVARVHRVLGAGTRVDVSLVSDLPPLPSGKHRYVICDIGESPEQKSARS